jgi:hypothetical protein
VKLQGKRILVTCGAGGSHLVADLARDNAAEVEQAVPGHEVVFHVAVTDRQPTGHHPQPA